MYKTNLLSILVFLICFNICYGTESFKKKLLDLSDCNCNSGLTYSIENSTVLPPWQLTVEIVDLKKKDIVVCGAIILNRKFVVSSANCFKNINISIEESLITNIINRTLDINKNVLKIEIEKIIKDENYVDYEFDEDHYLHSFVLIELKEYLNFTAQLQPACLIDENYQRSYIGQSLLMGSWTTVQQIYIDENYRQIFTKTPVTKFREFFSYLRYNSFAISYSNNAQENIAYEFCLSKEILCVTPIKKSACYGSEGSPLYLKIGKKYHVVAMNIFNYPLYVNNTLSGVPIYGQCLWGKFDMFLKIEKVFELAIKHIGENKVCKVKLPESLSPEYKKPIFTRKSNIFKNCDCSSKKLSRIGTSLLSFSPRTEAILESDDFGWIVQIFSMKKKQYSFVCTGVIVNKLHILTTANCLFKHGQLGLYLYLKNKPFEPTDFVKIDDYIKAKEYFFDYGFNVYDEKGYAGIIRLENEINFEKFKHFQPACFQREDDTTDYSLDFIFALTQELDKIGFKNTTKLSKNRNPLHAIAYRITGNDDIVLDQDCDPFYFTCLVIQANFKFTEAGSILHRIVRRSIQVISFFSHTHQLQIFSNQQFSVFTDVLPNLDYIEKYVGGPYEICKMDESNKRINRSDCLCEFNLKDIGKTMPWYVSILKIKSRLADKIFIEPICRGTILNDFWVLSTSECYFLNKNYSIYVSLSPIDVENGYFFNFKISLGEIIKVHYVVPAPFYNDKTNENNIALYKLASKMVKRRVDYSAACMVNKMNETDFSEELILVQIGNRLVSLKENHFNDSYCQKIENICFEGDEEMICDHDMGSPVVRVLHDKSYIIGYYSELFTSFCENKTRYEVKRISKGIVWINTIVEDTSYCLEDFFDLPQKIDLCHCYSSNNDVLITHHFSDSSLIAICSGIILSEFFVAIATRCLPDDFHVKNYRIVSDLNSYSEDKILISSLSIKPYHISHKFNDRGPITLLRTEKRLKLGKKTNFYPACLSSDKRLNKLNNVNFLTLRSQILKTFVNLQNPKNNVCDNYNTYCVTTEVTTCKSDVGVSVKQNISLRESTLQKYFTVGLFEKVRSSEKNGLVHRLSYEENWIGKRIGLGRMCQFEFEENLSLECSCEYRGSLQSRIFNGSEISPKSLFTFLVQIVFYQERIDDSQDHRDTVIWVNLIGGGVVLHYDWVLTSKNAIKPYNLLNNKDKIFVAMGNKFSEDSQNYHLKSNLIKIEKIIYYNEGQDDIALIKVVTSFDLGSRTGLFAPCVRRQKLKNFDEALLLFLGFGYSKTPQQKREKVSVDFKMVKFTTYTDQQIMQKKYPTLCDEKKYCLPGNLGSVCKGDVGGPLLEIRNNVIELIGIIYANDTYRWAYDSDQVLCKQVEVNVFTLINPDNLAWMLKTTSVKDFCKFSA